MKILEYITKITNKVTNTNRKLDTWIDVIDQQIEEEGRVNFDVDVDEDGPFIIYEREYLSDR
tara:strand:- start:844 stop:1029 length:186 start_codon:yes stop_codon:yes gene_type:complete